MYRAVPHIKYLQKIFAVCAFLLNIINNIYAQDTTLTSRVLVVENTGSAISIAVATDYMQRRKVSNVLNISCPDGAVSATAENINYADYLTAIETPLLAYLATHTQIDFIVLTKGVPIRITKAPDKPNGNCSLDSRLASLGYQESAGSSIVVINDTAGYGSGYFGNAWANKFFNSSIRFNHRAFGGYLVTRLDGYTQADAIALTTRSLQAEQQMSDSINNPGPILLDVCPYYGFTKNEPQPYSLFPPDIYPAKLFILQVMVNLGLTIQTWALPMTILFQNGLLFYMILPRFLSVIRKSLQGMIRGGVMIPITQLRPIVPCHSRLVQLAKQLFPQARELFCRRMAANL
jgi:hypothetical protein